MGRRCAWIMVAGLAVGPAAGCMSWPHVPEPPPNSGPTTAHAPQPEKNLPPEKTASIMLALAEELEKKGQPAKAVACYEKARELNPECVDHLAPRLAILYDQADDPNKALAEFTKALKQHPKDANLLNNLGYHWYTCGNWSEAEKYFRQALAVDDKHARARMNLGLALGMQGRIQEAMDAFCEVVSPAEAYANLGFTLWVQKKMAESRTAYAQALALDPSSRRAQEALAKFDGVGPAVERQAGTP